MTGNTWGTNQLSLIFMLIGVGRVRLPVRFSKKLVKNIQAKYSYIR